MPLKVSNLWSQQQWNGDADGQEGNAREVEQDHKVMEVQVDKAINQEANEIGRELCIADALELEQGRLTHPRIHDQYHIEYNLGAMVQHEEHLLRVRMIVANVEQIELWQLVEEDTVRIGPQTLDTLEVDGVGQNVHDGSHGDTHEKLCPAESTVP